MRELQGLSYEELASALAVSVPAVKSLLLRARTGLVDIAIARDTPCADIRDELLSAADRSVRISGRARRHCSECDACEAYRGELRRVRRGFAALDAERPARRSSACCSASAEEAARPRPAAAAPRSAAARSPARRRRRSRSPCAARR